MLYYMLYLLYVDIALICSKFKLVMLFKLLKMFNCLILFKLFNC